MALKTWYSTGTVSVGGGSTTVTGDGLFWGDDAIMPGDLFCDPAQPAIPPQRVREVTADNELELWAPWPGAAMVDAAYEIRYVGIIERSTAQTRRVLEQLGEISAYYDLQVDDQAARLALDTAENPARPGFRVLVSDTGDGRSAIYSKTTGAYGDWSDPAYLTGGPGDPGPFTDITFGPVTTLAPGSPASADVVQVDPSTVRVDFSIPSGQNGQDGEGVLPSFLPGEGINVDDSDPSEVVISIPNEGVTLTKGASEKLYGNDSRPRTPAQRFGDVIDLDDWLVGDGSTNNDAGIAALASFMAANPGKTYRGRRGRTWHFNTLFTLPPDVSLFLEGGRFRKMTNTGTGDTAITLSDRFRGDLLALDIPEGVTLYRGIKVASDSEGGFEVIAQEQQNNRGSDLHQAIHVDGDRVVIHELRAHRFDQAASLGTDALRRYEMRVKSVDIRHYMRGLHLRSISEFWIRNLDIRSRSPNGTPDPGQNSILMGACTDGWIGEGGLFDAPEHGFRMGGPTGCERIFVRDLLCQRSGQCGFKIWTGSVGVTTKDISLSNIRCVDSGDDGDGLAFNDFGFMLQGIDRLQASGLTAMNRDLSVSALDSFYLSGLTNGHLDGVSSINPQRHGMHISQWNGDGIQPQSFNTNIITGYQSEMANTVGNHVHMFFRDGYDVRDLMMPHMSFVGGNNGVRFDASTGEFPQPSYFSAIGRSLAGSLYSGQSGLSNVKTVNLMS